VLDPEDEDATILLNDGNYLSLYTAWYSRRLACSYYNLQLFRQFCFLLAVAYSDANLLEGREF